MLNAMSCRLAGLVFVMSLVLGAGCGPAEDSAEHRPDLQAISVQREELPPWLRPTDVPLGCETSARGTFAGEDSAHLYPLTALPGREVTIRFAGAYSWKHGAAVALYRAPTGELARLRRNPWDSGVTVRYETRDEQSFLLAVYSLSWEADGPYLLEVECRPLRD
jgi:hypothetical protein